MSRVRHSQILVWECGGECVSTFTGLVLGCDQKQLDGYIAILACIPHNTVETLHGDGLFLEGEIFPAEAPISPSRVMAAKWLLVNAQLSGLQPEINSAWGNARFTGLQSEIDQVIYSAIDNIYLRTEGIYYLWLSLQSEIDPCSVRIDRAQTREPLPKGVLRLFSAKSGGSTRSVE